MAAPRSLKLKHSLSVGALKIKALNQVLPVLGKLAITADKKVHEC